jgi:hypothetical protein
MWRSSTRSRNAASAGWPLGLRSRQVPSASIGRRARGDLAVRWDITAEECDQMIKYATAIPAGTDPDRGDPAPVHQANEIHPAYRATVELGPARKTTFIARYCATGTSNARSTRASTSSSRRTAPTIARLDQWARGYDDSALQPLLYLAVRAVAVEPRAQAVPAPRSLLDVGRGGVNRAQRSARPVSARGQRVGSVGLRCIR